MLGPPMAPLDPVNTLGLEYRMCSLKKLRYTSVYKSSIHFWGHKLKAVGRLFK